MVDFMEDQVEDEESSVEVGDNFEIEIKSLFERAGFSEVKTKETIHISSEEIEIDCIAKFGKNLFIIECKSGKSRGKLKKLQVSEIREWRDKVNTIITHFSNKKDKDFEKIIPILAIKRMGLTPQGETILQNGPDKIFLIDEQFLDYYNDLSDKIKENAVYSILNEISKYSNIPFISEPFQIPAIKTKLGGRFAFIFYANPLDLIKISYVARRGRGDEEFYQRTLEKNKLKRIEKYVDTGGYFPSNIILSLRGPINDSYYYKIYKKTPDWEFVFLNITGQNCWVIDGQHRLFGAVRAKQSDLVPCIALTLLKPNEERSLFLDINKEQKPVSSDLIWDLEGEADPYCETEEGLISNIVKMIDSPPANFADLKNNPFENMIYIPKKGQKTESSISISAFCSGIKNSRITRDLLPNLRGINNPLYDENKMTQRNRTANTISRYFKSIYEKITKENARNYVFGNAGVPVLLYLFEPILSHIERIPSREALSKYVEVIGEYFMELDETAIREIKLSTTNEGARKDLAKKIGVEIKRKVGVSFWESMEEEEIFDKIQNLERNISIMIRNTLQIIDSKWEKSRIPGDIQGYINEKKKKENGQFEDFIDLGQEINIISQKNNWTDCFENIFVKPNGFANLGELQQALSKISFIRGPYGHGSSGRIINQSKEDVSICENYIKKINKIIVPLIDKTEMRMEDSI
ncbi:MAG: DGQHR domain-containing protein [Candidatus Micrarchaeota archaeon]